MIRRRKGRAEHRVPRGRCEVESSSVIFLPLRLSRVMRRLCVRLLHLDHSADEVTRRTFLFQAIFHQSIYISVRDIPFGDSHCTSPTAVPPHAHTTAFIRRVTHRYVIRYFTQYTTHDHTSARAHNRDAGLEHPHTYSRACSKPAARATYNPHRASSRHTMHYSPLLPHSHRFQQSSHSFIAQ